MKHKIVLVIFIATLTGCMHSEIAVRPLDAVIVESAQNAKRAGADSLKIELSVVTAKKGSLEIPTSVVTFGAEKSVSNSTKVIVEIKDLHTWLDPTTIKSISDANEIDIIKKYILDTRTFKLK